MKRKLTDYYQKRTRREYLFPERFLSQKEAEEMFGESRKGFIWLREKYQIPIYIRGKSGRVSKYSLYDVQDAIEQYKQDYFQALSGKLAVDDFFDPDC